MEFAFSQRTYDVNEEDRFVRVTVDLITGSLDRAIPVTVTTSDIFATGKINFKQPLRWFIDFVCFDRLCGRVWLF